MSPKKYKFIVLEGIDGAGKSTVSRKLAKAIGGTLYRTPPPGFSTARRLIDTTAELPSRFLFYLSSVTYASEAIKKLIRQQHVICDRYLVTTVAYHRAMGLNFDFDLRALNLVKPDFTFFLELGDETERQRRLRERRRYTATDAILDNNRIRNKLLREYRNHSMISVDTSHISPDEVVQKIRQRAQL